MVTHVYLMGFPMAFMWAFHASRPGRRMPLYDELLHVGLMRAMKAWVMAWSTWLSGDVMDSWSKCPISAMKSSIVQC